eukprot:g10652.t1
MRANIKRSLITLTDENLGMDSGSKPLEWRKIQFALKLFHAVLQERRKFGPLGFNVRYEFNDSDLECSTEVVKNLLELDGDVPWDTINFVVGQINYGGRVTDDNDRKCLMAILATFMTPDLLGDEYAFSVSGIYAIPPGDLGKVETFRDYAEKLPLTEQPEVFGMHENANISYLQMEAEKTLNVILEIQPREAGGGGAKSPEEIVLEIVQDQKTRVPEKLTEEGSHASSFANLINKEGVEGMTNPMGTGLRQEMIRFNGLINQVGRTLGEVEKAIKGFVVMTADLDAMFSNLQNNQTPGLWAKVGYPSLKPLSSWFEDFIDRVAFFDGWVKGGLPPCFWLSAFFFPQGYLTSVQQNYSRTNIIPVDILSFEFQPVEFDDPALFIDAQQKDPENYKFEGIIAYGMFFDGAKWDMENMCLGEQDYGIMYNVCPLINFIPSKDHKINPEQYMCPFYKTSIRAGTLSTTGHSTNFVVPIELDTMELPSYWTLKGTALLSMLNV